jgi:hypothetical protein
MTLIVGSEGSMGKRYQAILKYINEEFECHDLMLNRPVGPLEKYDRFIVATPTITHLGWVRALDCYERPILCEKPISKNLGEVREVLACKSPLTMQMQYLELSSKNDMGHSYYDYYHHGPDGLVWDCFQIIALAKGTFSLYEKSPIWECMINGRQLSRSSMDLAYVDYVKKWIKGEELTPRSSILAWHEKVSKYEEKCAQKIR